MSQSENSFRPLSWGFFFNSILSIEGWNLETGMFSSPFLGTFFQFVAENHEDFEKWKAVFVPFLGDLFSMMVILLLWLGCMSFRPLSWGLSFNVFTVLNDSGDVVFVPFPGDFLSIWEIRLVYGSNSVEFSSPFLGTFFQWDDLNKGLIQFGFRPLSWGLSFNHIEDCANLRPGTVFSSPFLGTFFQ